MAENTHARFFTRALLDFRANNRTNSAESRLAGFGVRAGSDEAAVFLSRAFRDNDDCEFFADVLAVLNFIANALVGERNLWNQNHVRAACHAGKEGDPAGITTHDFENHNAVVTFSSGM